MLASPLSPSMPSLEPVPAPILPPVSALHSATDQPPALELYDALNADSDNDDEDDEDDDDDDDDSSDGKLAADVSLSDDAEPADGQAETEEGAEGAGEGDEEEEEEDEEELPVPCPRFYIHLKQFGPYVNYNTLLKHEKQLTGATTTTQPQPPTSPTNPSTNTTTTTPTATATTPGTALPADTAAAATAGDTDGDDVLIVGEGRRRRKRQSTQDEYDTNDPFIDDTELPQEREEDDMRTEIEGFHVQIGTVQVKEREVAVKQEQGGAADEGRRKRQRKEWTKRQIPMSAAMAAQLDKIVKECQLLGGSEALGGSHRRLPDELVELLVQLNDIYDKDSAAWDATERKILKHNMLERLEATMGQTRQAIRSRMKTAVQRHRRDQLDQQIRSYKQSLQKAAAHDYSDFHHRISSMPQPSATNGNVIVHRSADGGVERYEYRPRFSLWMDELLTLTAAVVEAACVQRGDDGRAIEAEGWQVEKELWDEVAGWWGAGVMTAKLIADRVKQARKERRRKKAQQKQATNPTATAAHPTPTAGRAASTAAVKQAKESEKGKDSKESKQSRDVKQRADKIKEKEKEKRKRDSGAAATDKVKQKKARTDGKEAAKASSGAADGHKSASAKQQKDGGREKDSTHKRSVSATASSASSSSVSAPTGSKPVQSSVFYEPPSGPSRWADVHFPHLPPSPSKAHPANLARRRHRPTCSSHRRRHDYYNRRSSCVHKSAHMSLPKHFFYSYNLIVAPPSAAAA